MIIPPPPEHVSSGILLNGFISAVVCLTAATFAIFLMRRWSRLSPLMKVYAFVWIVTIFPWLGIATRYFMYVSHVNNESIYVANELFLQTAIYASGIPLLIYLARLLFKSRWIIWLFTVESIIGFGAAVWFLFQPNGLNPAFLSDFTVDATVNTTSLYIFDVLAGTVIILLLYHFFYSLYKWYRGGQGKISYATWYSLSLLIYVGLGSIDQIKVITGWPIVAFRVLYAAAFLFAYLITISDEEASDDYLVVSRSA